MLPASYVVPWPIDITTLPALPFVAAPVLNINAPEAPELVVPEVK